MKIHSGIETLARAPWIEANARSVLIEKTVFDAQGIAKAFGGLNTHRAPRHFFAGVPLSG
jgi:hypothetical protein